MKLISLFIATFCIWLSSWSNPTYPLLPYPQKITFTGKQLILDQIHLETTESSISNGKTGYKATRHPQPLYKPIRSLKLAL